MVPEREFDPSCVRFVEATRADGSVPERKLKGSARYVSCPASEGKVPEMDWFHSLRYVSDVRFRLKRARGRWPVMPRLEKLIEVARPPASHTMYCVQLHGLAVQLMLLLAGGMLWHSPRSAACSSAALVARAKPPIASSIAAVGEHGSSREV